MYFTIDALFDAFMVSSFFFVFFLPHTTRDGCALSGRYPG
jgi:hypothetical protein